MKQINQGKLKIAFDLPFKLWDQLMIASLASILTAGAFFIAGGFVLSVLISIGALNWPSPELFELEILNLYTDPSNSFDAL